MAEYIHCSKCNYFPEKVLQTTLCLKLLMITHLKEIGTIAEKKQATIVN